MKKNSNLDIYAHILLFVFLVVGIGYYLYSENIDAMNDNKVNLSEKDFYRPKLEEFKNSIPNALI
tara:strand:+ start:510 stop:704 length:195 start_codon:yes stop_codon:yes gene_type:complete